MTEVTRVRRASFNEWLYARHGRRIMGGLRRTENEETFQIREAFCDVMYKEKGVPLEKEALEAFYYAGRERSGLRESFPRSCHIRRVVSSDGEADFRQYLPLMRTLLVGDGTSYTVLPFPFKYLREHEKKASAALRISAAESQ